MQKHDAAESTAATILKCRRLRTELFPGEMFGEPAWDILLELFVAGAMGQRLNGREISRRTNGSPPVISRWMMHLDSEGFISGGEAGDLDAVLSLSPEALTGIEQVMNRAGTAQARVPSGIADT